MCMACSWGSVNGEQTHLDIPDTAVSLWGWIPVTDLIVSPPNSYVEVLTTTPIWLYLETESFNRWGEVISTDPNLIWLVSLWEEEVRTPDINTRKSHVRTHKKGNIYNSRRKGSEEMKITAIQPLKLWENKFQLFKPHWGFPGGSVVKE